jgi:RNA polymerase sigma-70 factor (ECF subfamily)
VSHSAMQREFMEMLEAHGPALMAMLRRLCGGRHDAEDVFQDTAVRIWRGFSGRPRIRNPRGWIMTIGYRAFLDARERKRGHEDLQDPADPRSAEPDGNAEHSEACDNVQAAIAKLSDPIREVVVCHYLGGLTLSQTAAAMKLSQGTVKSRLNAALSKLRSVLE